MSHLRRKTYLLFNLKWVFIESVEHGGEITLTSVRQQGHDGLALVLRTLGNLRGSVGCGTRGDTYEHTVVLCQFTSGTDGIIILYIEHLVDECAIIGLGYEAGTNTLDLMRTALSAVKYG